MKSISTHKFPLNSTDTNRNLSHPIAFNRHQRNVINTYNILLTLNKIQSTPNNILSHSITVNRYLLTPISFYRSLYKCLLMPIAINSTLLQPIAISQWLKNFSQKNGKLCFCTHVVRTKTFFHSPSEKKLALHGGRNCSEVAILY